MQETPQDLFTQHQTRKAILRAIRRAERERDAEKKRALRLEQELNALLSMQVTDEDDHAE